MKKNVNLTKKLTPHLRHFENQVATGADPMDIDDDDTMPAYVSDNSNGENDQFQASASKSERKEDLKSIHNHTNSNNNHHTTTPFIIQQDSAPKTTSFKKRKPDDLDLNTPLIDTSRGFQHLNIPLADKNEIKQAFLAVMEGKKTLTLRGEIIDTTGKENILAKEYYKQLVYLKKRYPEEINEEESPINWIDDDGETAIDKAVRSQNKALLRWALIPSMRGKFEAPLALAKTIHKNTNDKKKNLASDIVKLIEEQQTALKQRQMNSSTIEVDSDLATYKNIISTLDDTTNVVIDTSKLLIFLQRYAVALSQKEKTDKLGNHPLVFFKGINFKTHFLRNSEEDRLESLKNVLVLMEIINKIKQIDHLDTPIGYTEADTIRKENNLMILFGSYRKQNKNVALIDIVASLTHYDYAKQLIIHFTKTLMRLPYKQARKHLSDSPFLKLSEYLTSKGLIHLSFALENDKNSPPRETVVDVINEIKNEYSTILIFLFKRIFSVEEKQNVLNFNDHIDNFTEEASKELFAKQAEVYKFLKKIYLPHLESEKNILQLDPVFIAEHIYHQLDLIYKNITNDNHRLLAEILIETFGKIIVYEKNRSNLNEIGGKLIALDELIIQDRTEEQNLLVNGISTISLDEQPVKKNWKTATLSHTNLLIAYNKLSKESKIERFLLLTRIYRKLSVGNSYYGNFADKKIISLFLEKYTSTTENNAPSFDKAYYALCHEINDLQEIKQILDKSTDICHIKLNALKKYQLQHERSSLKELFVEYHELLKDSLENNSEIAIATLISGFTDHLIETISDEALINIKNFLGESFFSLTKLRNIIMHANDWLNGSNELLGAKISVRNLECNALVAAGKTVNQLIEALIHNLSMIAPYPGEEQSLTNSNNNQQVGSLPKEQQDYFHHIIQQLPQRFLLYRNKEIQPSQEINICINAILTSTHLILKLSNLISEIDTSEYINFMLKKYPSIKKENRLKYVVIHGLLQALGESLSVILRQDDCGFKIQPTMKNCLIPNDETYLQELQIFIQAMAKYRGDATHCCYNDLPGTELILNLIEGNGETICDHLNKLRFVLETEFDKACQNQGEFNRLSLNELKSITNDPNETYESFTNKYECYIQ